ncbi:MAG: hypothetical protein HRU25_00200 [Psychrobium sp.]|nr:hypothetical protein [Psychrobium sp.]
MLLQKVINIEAAHNNWSIHASKVLQALAGGFEQTIKLSTAVDIEADHLEKLVITMLNDIEVTTE